MFVVWVGTLVTLALTIQPDLFGPSGASRHYNGIVTVVLALTVWFANYAEALAEGRGKAKATALRQTRADLVGVRVLEDGRTEQVPAADLRKGDLIRVEKNDVVPADGDVVEGMAYVNEAAITGELAPVLKEPGTDMFSSVTAGTTIISDWLAGSRLRRSRQFVPRPHHPPRRRRQAAKDPQRGRAHRAAVHPDADLRHRRGGDGAGRHLSAGARSMSPILLHSWSR